jgi:hypothetical protein
MSCCSEMWRNESLRYSMYKALKEREFSCAAITQWNHPVSLAAGPALDPAREFFRYVKVVYDGFIIIAGLNLTEESWHPPSEHRHPTSL